MAGSTTPWGLPTETSNDLVTLSQDFAKLANASNAMGNDIVAKVAGAVTLGEGVDLNTVTTNGNYVALLASAHPNTPESGTGIVTVTEINSTAQVQVWRNYVTGAMWMRRSASNGWNPWRQIAGPEAIDAYNNRWRRDNLLVPASDLSALADGVHYIPSSATASALGLPTYNNGVIEQYSVGGNGKIQVWRTMWSDTQVWQRAYFNSGGTFSWQPWTRVDAGAASGGGGVSTSSSPEHLMRESEMRRRVGSIGTGGKAAVALVFDHGTNNFASIVWPKLTALGLRATLALNSQMYDPAQARYATDNATTWGQIRGWADTGRLEVANHGRTHLNYSSTAGIENEVRGGREELEANLSGLPIDSYVQTGLTTPAFGGFNNGATADAYWTTYAGQLILDSHAVVTGSLPGSKAYPLDGEVKPGVQGYWIDTPAQITTAQAAVTDAIAGKYGVLIRCHPELLNTGTYSTTAQLNAFLDWLAGQDVVKLQLRELAVADARVGAQGPAGPAGTVTDASVAAQVSGGSATDAAFKAKGDARYFQNIYFSRALLSPRSFGAVGDGVTDDTVALGRWLNDDPWREKLLTDGDYRITSGLTSSVAGRTIRSQGGARLIADFTAGTPLLVTGADSVVSLRLDGVEKATGGVVIMAGGGLVEGCVIENLGSHSLDSGNSAISGIRIATPNGGTVRNNRIRNIYAVGDATTGNGKGMTRGISLDAGGKDIAAVKATLVEGNYIEDVSGEEGDAIAVLFEPTTLGSADVFLKGLVTLRRNTIRNPSKRFLKVQASDCLIEDNQLLFDLGSVPASWNCHIQVYRGHRTIIRRNTTDPVSPSFQHISVTQGTTKMDGVVIEENLLRCGSGMTTQGLYGSDLVNATVRGNKVYGGTALLNRVDTSIISGNVISGGPDTMPAIDYNGAGSFFRDNTDLSTTRTATRWKVTGTATTSGNLPA